MAVTEWAWGCILMVISQLDRSNTRTVPSLYPATILDDGAVCGEALALTGQMPGSYNSVDEVGKEIWY